MTNFIETLATLCLAVQALFSTAEGTSSLPVRPPLGTRGKYFYASSAVAINSYIVVP